MSRVTKFQFERRSGLSKSVRVSEHNVKFMCAFAVHVQATTHIARMFVGYTADLVIKVNESEQSHMAAPVTDIRVTMLLSCKRGY
jgi:hypothetical protein